jgi:molybdopterin converting factor small subunit
MRIEAEESAKLEEERESEERQRQAEFAEAEQQRLAELEAARQQEELESRQAAETAMKELQARLDREGARSGDVQISLMWDNYNDLDLHVVCPSGERIHGGNKISECGGELDVDANVRPETKKPVENVVWDDETAQPGEYQVYVHHYKKHKKRRTKDPTKFKVIVNNVGELLEFDGKVSHGDPIQLVAQFDVPTMEERQSKIEAIRAELNILSGQGEPVIEEQSGNGEELVIEQESVIEEQPVSYEEPEIEIKIEDDDMAI